MARVRTVSALRNEVAAIVGDLLASSGSEGVANPVLLREIKQRKAADIAAMRDQLIDSMLIKLVNDVCRRRWQRGADRAQPDLFGEYAGVPRSVTVGRGIKKNPLAMSVRELRDWVHAHEARPVNQAVIAFRRLLRDAEAYCRSDDEILSEVLDVRSRALRRTAARSEPVGEPVPG